MEKVQLSSNDLALLKDKYSTLVYDLCKNTLSGVLAFDIQYGEDGVCIKDEYQIEIDFNHISESAMPIIRETADRIVKIALGKGLNPRDLHLNKLNGEMCLIIPPKIRERYPNGFDLEALLHHIEEHLYWISYFEKYNKPPWREYAHGEFGYLELYRENPKEYGEDFKKYLRCNSRLDFRKKIKELNKKYKK